MEDIARTKLDILYQDILGDVREILDRVEKLKEGLPAASNEAAGKLKVQVENILDAARLLGQGLNDISKQVDVHTQAAARNAAEAIKLDIKQSVADNIQEISSKMLKPEMKKVADEFEASSKNLDSSIKAIEARMQSATNNAVKRLSEATENMRIQRLWTIVYCIGGGFLGTSTSIMIFKLMH
jgi:ElaB/YqjD/DUF883 family membrane-anchored ribosome-binding protein